VNQSGTYEIEMWPIDRPKDYPKNARKWGAKAVEKVASSIQAYGWRQPVVVDSEGVIIIGHLRRTAGRSLGLTHVPVHVARDLTPELVRGLRLMDNRSHEEAGWDFELLGPELIDLQRLGFGLELTGFDEQELASAMTQRTDGLTDPDDCPAVPEAPVSKLGDLWLLGASKGHRVLCGDATSVDATERLCAGQKVDLVFCDSPYNVDYEGYTKDRLKIQGDRMNRAQFRQFLEAAFASHRAVIKPGGSLYICHSSSWQREFQDALEATGFDVRCQIIWAKSRTVKQQQSRRSGAGPVRRIRVHGDCLPEGVPHLPGDGDRPEVRGRDHYQMDAVYRGAGHSRRDRRNFRTDEAEPLDGDRSRAKLTCLSTKRKPTPRATSSSTFSSTRRTNGMESRFCSFLGRRKRSAPSLAK